MNDEPDFVICRTCDSNPCQCGRRQYGTPRENRAASEKETRDLYRDDPWAIPADRDDCE